MSWLKFRTVSESLKITRDLCQACSELGGPLSKQMFSFVEKEDYLSLIKYSFNYTELVESFISDDIFYARQIQALFSKQDYIDLGINTSKVAFDKFLACEEKCLETNNRLSTNASLESDVAIVSHYAQRKIASILGDLPNLGSFDFSFGPGATTSVKKAQSHPLVKLESSLTCSRNTLFSIPDLLEEAPNWRNSKVSNNRYILSPSISKLVFVPKTSLTDRPIGVEPTLNGFFQKGFGSYIKKRLLKFGIDLFDQSWNRSLAYRGSNDGTLATIDLSSASDTISYMTVLNLLPQPWFTLLESVRSSELVYDGKVYDLERFSSMGNSYTFELESLIFYSLSYGVCEYLNLDRDRQNLSVYGDDIIINVKAVDLLYKVLEYYGFEVNSKKSFTSGPFRESCGADFLSGIDIRPFYLKTQINDRVLFVMHNWFLRSGENKLASICKSYVLPHNRLFGPDGFGDGHLIGTYRLRTSRKLRRLGFEGGVFDTFSLKPRRLFKLRKLLEKSYVYPLYCTYVSDPEVESDHEVVPGTRGYHRLSIYTLKRSIFRPF